jgi:hypothetical protein
VEHKLLLLTVTALSHAAAARQAMFARPAITAITQQLAAVQANAVKLVSLARVQQLVNPANLQLPAELWEAPAPVQLDTTTSSQLLRNANRA